jgi:hypothetical protein
MAQGRRLGRSLVALLHRGLLLARQVMTQTIQRLWQMGRSCRSLAVWMGTSLANVGGAGLVVSSVSLAVGLYATLPTRFSVTPAAPLDPADILSTPFIVENAGYLPVHITYFICFFGSITTDSGAFAEGTGGHGMIHGVLQQVRQWTLAPTHKITIRCPQTFWGSSVGAVTSAELGIDLYYRPMWLPFGPRRRQTFFFTTATDSQGHLRWLP